MFDFKAFLWFVDYQKDGDFMEKSFNECIVPVLVTFQEAFFNQEEHFV